MLDSEEKLALSHASDLIDWAGRRYAERLNEENVIDRRTLSMLAVLSLKLKDLWQEE